MRVGRPWFENDARKKTEFRNVAWSNSARFRYRVPFNYAWRIPLRDSYFLLVDLFLAAFELVPSFHAFTTHDCVAST